MWSICRRSWQSRRATRPTLDGGGRGRLHSRSLEHDRRAHHAQCERTCARSYGEPEVPDRTMAACSHTQALAPVRMIEQMNNATTTQWNRDSPWAVEFEPLNDPCLACATCNERGLRALPVRLDPDRRSPGGRYRCRVRRPAAVFQGAFGAQPGRNLAERAGLSRRGISDLERGARRAPYAHTVQKLADALGLADAERTRFVSASRGRLVAQALPATPEQSPAVSAALTSFVGRERALTAISELLKVHRFTTLTGPGGIGKTRLARAVADLAGTWHRDGVRVVECWRLSPVH